MARPILATAAVAALIVLHAPSMAAGTFWTAIWVAAATLFVWWAHRSVSSPRLKVFCPGCRRDLCNDPDPEIKVGVESSEVGADVIRYTCPCGEESRWLFEAPVPLLLRRKDP